MAGRRVKLPSQVALVASNSPRAAGWHLCSLALTAALAGLPQTAAAQAKASDSQLRHGRLDSILNAVVATYERNLDSAPIGQGIARTVAQDAAGRIAARRAPMSQGASVAATFHISDASKVKALTRFLKDNGGDPRNAGKDYAEAYVPAGLLAKASKQPGVLWVQAIVPPQAKRGPTTSQGVAAHDASLWHMRGITGKGVKVGVIDTGFSGIRALLGSELPASVTARCYRDMGRHTSRLRYCRNEGEVHGTAVAEALLDIAPDVSLYVADPVSRGDLRNTVRWMANRGVQVINYSVGWRYDGPGDGTSPFSVSPLNAVDAAVRRGIVWVNAAGNEGQSTWFGQFRDADGDDFHDFGDGPNSESPLECIPLAVPSEDRVFSVQLRWQGRWGTKDRLADLDLLLYERFPLREVASSEDYQNYFSKKFPGSRIPAEYLRYEAQAEQAYCLAVKRFANYVRYTPRPGWIQLVEHRGVPFAYAGYSYHTPSGSIGNPAESANPGLLAAGVAPWNATETIADYSSRGPTPDGRMKPDIVGVDRADSSSYRTSDNPSGAWLGTSQASPHVAGLAALIRRAYPRYSPEQVAEYLKSNAAPRRTFDSFYGRFRNLNNIWGYGLARLPPIPSIVRQSRAYLSSNDGSRRVPLSRYFPTADAYTTFTATSSDPQLAMADVLRRTLVITPVENREGQVTITVTALFRDGLQVIVRIVLTVEGALPWPRPFSGWRLGLYEDIDSPPTPSGDAFIE